MSKANGSHGLKHLLFKKLGYPFASIPVLPVRLHQTSANRLIQVEMVGETFIQRSFSGPVTTQMGWGLDKFALRDGFESIKERSALREFLELCGPFRDENLPQEITWSDFLAWQKLIRGLRDGRTIPDSWPTRMPTGDLDHIHFVSQLQLVGCRREDGVLRSPYALIPCDSALEIIAATVLMDNLRGAKFGTCQHCGSLFEFKNNHGRSFCRPEHARLKSQKTRREKAKNLRDAEARAARDESQKKKASAATRSRRKNAGL